MSSKINLISNVKVDETKDQKANKLKKISFFLLTFVAFLAIIIFLINFRFSAAQISKEQNELLNELAIYNDTVAKMFVLKTRVDGTAKILNNRNTHNETINLLLVNKPSSIEIEEFDLDEVHLNIVFSAESLEDVNSFINNLLVLSDKEIFSNITLEELSIKSSKFVVEIDANKL